LFHVHGVSSKEALPRRKYSLKTETNRMAQCLGKF
jgi:hypothetical protein